MKIFSLIYFIIYLTLNIIAISILSANSGNIKILPFESTHKYVYDFTVKDTKTFNIYRARYKIYNYDVKRNNFNVTIFDKDY